MNSQARILLAITTALLSSAAFADDWPQWGGPKRTGDWNETGILEKFPDGGLAVKWRAPVGSGYSGPVVADGKVFILDYKPDAGDVELVGVERALCLDEATGKTLWTREWPVNYRVLMQSYATGPRATPAYDEGRLHLIGSVGAILCLDAKTGEIIWQHDAPKEFDAEIATWGTSSSPLVDGPRVIHFVGAKPEGKAMAFDKATGKELWRAIASDGEIGYSQPIIYEAGGKRQLMVWHPAALESLDPETGKVYWKEKFKVPYAMSIATPALGGSRLLVSNFYGGSMMMNLDAASPTATKLWEIKGKKEFPDQTRGLHAVITTPILIGDYIYGTCSYGELRCLKADTGERVWATDKFTRQGRWGSMFWARNGDRYFVNNDVGEFMILRFKPEGVEEISRTKLIEPDTNSGFGPRRFFESTVNWVYPAYANRHVVTRNDKEVLRASLEKP